MMIILSMMMSFYQRNSNTKDPSKLANNTRPAIKKFNSRKGNQNLHPPTEKNKKKKMQQRLSILLAQVQAGFTFEYLLNKIRQTVYSLYQAKQISKKVYHNLKKSI